MARKTPRSVEGRVRDMAGADGVLESDHGVIFVPRVVPGDVVRVESIRRRGKTLRGRLARLLEASPDRRQPPCDIVDRCGGCPWMPIADARQAALKRARVARLGQDAQWHEAATLEYRHRARFAWHGRTLGYRERSGHRIVDVERCVVLDAPRHAAWTRLRTLVELLSGEGEILLGPAGDGAVALLRTDAAQSGELYARCPALLDDALRGIVLEVAGARASWGETQESYVVDGGLLASPIGGFAQGHGVLNEALVQHVASQVPEEARVLELYCGAGNLSVRLARSASAWLGVELDADAVEACRHNLRSRGLRGKVIEASAEAFPPGRWDVVVLDPPRAGAREAVARIGATKAERVVYVSCHLATLERDLRALDDAGYRLESCAAFDMFPQTPHLELVATLVRA